MSRIKASSGKRKYGFIYWIFLTCYCVILAVIVLYGLSFLWNYLEGYEASRPVHFMDKTMTLFDKNNRDILENYISDVDCFEGEQAVRKAFYDDIEGKNLKFMKAVGRYSDSRPAYVVTADDIAEAVVYLDYSKKDYELFGNYKLSQVELLVDRPYAVNVKVRNDVTVWVNDIQLTDEYKVAQSQVAYDIENVYYQVNGLVNKPFVVAVDKNLRAIELNEKVTVDEKGAYQLEYSMAKEIVEFTLPVEAELLVNGEPIGEKNLISSNIKTDYLDFISGVINKYPDYEPFLKEVESPVLKSYYFDAYGDEKYEAKIGDTVVDMPYDEVTGKYNLPVINHTEVYDAATDIAVKFAVQNTLVNAEKAPRDSLKPFFIPNSSYYVQHSALICEWFYDHWNYSLSDEQVEEFFAYNDSIAYVKVTLNQNMYAVAYHGYVSLPVVQKLWLFRDGEQWYVMMIDYSED